MGTTIAFVLGMVSVAFTAALVLGVLAFFKVLKLRHDLLNTQMGSNTAVDNLYTTINANRDDAFQEINRVHQEINSGMDSRMNKLENKLPALTK